VIVVALGALSLQRNDNFASQLAIWRDTVTKRPHNARAHTNLGAALVGCGQLNEAHKQFDEVVRLQPAYADAHYNLGVVFAVQRNYPGSAYEFRETVRLEPDNAPA
jgi:Flp pilus assembly protein TadD